MTSAEQDGYKNGWAEWSRFVLKELERLNGCYDDINEKVGLIREEIVALKIKAGVWGLLGGMIPVAITLMIYIIIKLFANQPID